MKPILIAAIFIIILVACLILRSKRDPVGVIRSGVIDDNIEVVREYLDAGGDPDLSIRSGGSYKSQTHLIHLAAQAGSFRVCKLLIESGVDVDATDFSGRTPIMCVFAYDVCQDRRKKIFGLFLLKSNLKIADHSGMNILHYSALFGNESFYRQIVEVDPTLEKVEDSTGRTPREILEER